MYHMARIAVTGARGFVAGRLRRLLARRGDEVVLVSRGDPAPVPGEHVAGVSGYAGLARALRGADALVHLAGVGRQTADGSFCSVNEALVRDVARACKGARVRRIVHVSGLGASPTSGLAYFVSKHMGERAITESGVDHVVFRPSYIVGRGDPLGRHLRARARSGRLVIPGSGRWPLQPIHVDDAARILADAATSARYGGRTLDLVGPDRISFRRYAALFCPGARIESVPLEGALRDAVAGGDPGVDDLSIMVSGITGDHGTLAGLHGAPFRRVVRLLEAGRRL